MNITDGRTVEIDGIMGNFYDKLSYGIFGSDHARAFAYSYN
ncbi:hypothetical protein DSBG_2206 [Desulfosporosinus sp. BG]|nr:hypothetical protein DSBG_2206 [Desulfosporosinus sp. BG]